MSVQNSLSPKKNGKTNGVVYFSSGNQITLTPETVKNYLVSGDKDRVTMQEVMMFINLCQHNCLDPWTREAYLIKFGSEPATIVAAKEAYTKRAESNENFNGYDAGIILFNEETNEVNYRKGSFKLPNETLVGGYAEVWRKDREHSYRIEVSLDEYIGKKKDGNPTMIWKTKPTTMIRKVALVQALREAFPGNIKGAYIAEEVGMDEPIEAEFTEIPQEAQQSTQEPVEERYKQQSFTQGGAADALFGDRQ